VFRLPVLASSPLDFWSRRWNLFYSRWAYRNLVFPLRRVLRPLPAVAAVFVVSAAFHEYLVLLTLGETRGEMTAFFLLQGAAVIAEIWWRRNRGPRRLPRLAAWTLQSAWMGLTTVLFFARMERILAFDMAHRI